MPASPGDLAIFKALNDATRAIRRGVSELDVKAAIQRTVRLVLAAEHVGNSRVSIENLTVAMADEIYMDAAKAVLS